MRSPVPSLFAAAILALAASVSAHAAAIACVPDTVAVYSGQSDGCTVGQFTLKNFNWNSVSQTGYVRVDAAAVNVAPAATSNSIDVNFSSSAFSVQGNNKILAFLDYLIDPPPPILDDMNLFLDANTPVFPGFARVTANICIGDLFSNNCSAGIVHSLLVQSLGAGNPSNIQSASVSFPFPVNIVDVRTTIELDANGASSQINGYGSVTTTVPGDPVPEPSTAATVLGAALLGFAGLRYSRSQRRSA